VVEAPGTAPGSERFIAKSVYRHSRLAPAPLNISARPQGGKSGPPWPNRRSLLPARDRGKGASGLAAILMTLVLPDDVEDRALAEDGETAAKPATA